MTRLAVLLLSLLALAGPAAAQDIPEIARARALLEKSAEALKDARSGRAQLDALGKAVSAHEVALSAYRAGLRQLAAAEAAAVRTLDADRVRFEELTLSLQSIGRAPRSALLAHPSGPIAAARGAGLMAEISPVIEQRVSAYRLRVDQLRRLRSEQDAARVEVRGALAGLQDLRAATLSAVRRNRSRDLPGREELAAQAELAARQARSLGSLAGSLKSSEQPGSELSRFHTTRRHAGGS